MALMPVKLRKSVRCIREQLTKYKMLDKMLSEKETVIAEVRYLYATKDSILNQPTFVCGCAGINH